MVTVYHIRAVPDVKRNRIKYYFSFTDAYIPFIGSSKVDENGNFIKSPTLIKFLNNNPQFLCNNKMQ